MNPKAAITEYLKHGGIAAGTVLIVAWLADSGLGIVATAFPNIEHEHAIPIGIAVAVLSAIVDKLIGWPC